MKRGLLTAGVAIVVTLVSLTAIAMLRVPSATGYKTPVTPEKAAVGIPGPRAESAYRSLTAPAQAPTHTSTLMPTSTPAPTQTTKPIQTSTSTPTSTPAPALTPTAPSTPSPTPRATDTTSPSTTPIPGPTLAPSGEHLPFYGMDMVRTEHLGNVAGLEIEVVGQVFRHNGTPESWLDQLDEAEMHGPQVIAWLWPQGWEWDGAIWQVDSQARSFVETVAGHPATFAVYALHEPYWQGCWGCGYTTHEQQLLYDAIKAIADVPIYSAVDSMAFWTTQGEDTAFADGICDYCETWYYPFRTDGYHRDRFLEQLHADLAVARERAPNSKIVWAMQAFAQDPPGFRMPTSTEMYDLAGEVYAAGVDGALWYPWTFNTLYDDFLSNHPELHGTVREVYQDHVLPRR